MPLTSRASNYEELRAAACELSGVHLSKLMSDSDRCRSMCAEFDGIFLDYSRTKLNGSAMNGMFKLCEEMGVSEKIRGMFQGDILNKTEGRSVLHVALRGRADEKYCSGGRGVMGDVQGVLSQVKRFASSVRDGSWTGFTGKPLKDVVCIGIGGSYLGPEFVYEALRTDAACAEAAKGRRLRFLANVDPVDVARALEGLQAETTLVVVVSKTFTTAETMLNARTVRNWLLKSLHNEKAISNHMVAVSTNISAAGDFGINAANVFGVWDWVGGRFSVCSSVGVLPLALHYGWSAISAFLDGCRSMDEHFHSAPLRQNLPVLLGITGVWNSTFMGHGSLALLPYSQSLLRFPAHIQQVAMESNGKRVTEEGLAVDYNTEQVVFGEPGTNGQHSFYQLIHQGRVVPAEFIGAAVSQHPLSVSGEPVSNHDELMANFFAQPDALAFGKSEAELEAEGVPPALIPHKAFPGDRPSLSILLPKITPKTVGQLLALYEHRVAVQGFIWGINSFDQWGVELGKVLAKNTRSLIQAKLQKAQETLNHGNPHSPNTAQSVATSLDNNNLVHKFHPNTNHLVNKYVLHNLAAQSQNPNHH